MTDDKKNPPNTPRDGGGITPAGTVSSTPAGAEGTSPAGLRPWGSSNEPDLPRGENFSRQPRPGNERSRLHLEKAIRLRKEARGELSMAQAIWVAAGRRLADMPLGGILTRSLPRHTPAAPMPAPARPARPRRPQPRPQAPATPAKERKRRDEG